MSKDTIPDVPMILELYCPELYAIDKERRRQVAKGFDSAHDDSHHFGQLACAAAFYAELPWMPHAEWPFDEPAPEKEANYESRIADLVKAGALVVAEIQRLKRICKKKR